jgi:hypothetical protein
MKGIPMTSDAAFTLDTVVRRIVELRGQRVILGHDLAVMYGVEYRALIQAVKRNKERFPEDFMFQLSTGVGYLEITKCDLKKYMGR